jgi:hypothetical protein
LLCPVHFCMDRYNLILRLCLSTGTAETENDADREDYLCMGEVLQRPFYLEDFFHVLILV